MDTKSKAYADFGRMMCEDKVYIDSAVDFETICTWLKVPPRELDRLLSFELGCTGPALMEVYRDLYRSRFKEKYGIKYR